MGASVVRGSASSPPSRQRAAAIEGPHDAIGADEAQDGAPAQRLEGRLPGREREGVRAADDGQLARRRRDGALIDAGDPASGLVRHVDGVQLARQHLGQVRGLALDGLIEEYELSFESGERMRGRFLVTRLDYAGDFNGERSYTLALESSGPVTSL